MDESGAVYLVFYRMGKKWWNEPALNIMAAIAQNSPYTHVEIAIGSETGSHGQMVNVCRIYNDSVGVELCNRTGMNPQYTYLQIGCSKKQESDMLKTARSFVGKPFSSMAMARSLVWPRKTDGTSFFCAGSSLYEPPPLSSILQKASFCTSQVLILFVMCVLTVTQNSLRLSFDPVD